MGKIVTTCLIDGDLKGTRYALDFCIGSSNNGWLVWKNKDGNTLDEIYRKPLE